MNRCFKWFFGLSLWFTLVACSGGEDSHAPAAERIIPAQLGTELRAVHRKLPLEGAHNFRDLGGYLVPNDQRVMWGALYRSDALDELTDEDVAYVSRLGIRTFVDFRTVQERLDGPDRLPASAMEKSLPIEIALGPPGLNTGTSMDEIKDKVFSGEIDLSNTLVDINRALVTDFTATYREFLLTLLEKDEGAVLFHCTAGKDRAGFAAALVLRILGVPKERVIEEYLLTNVFTEKETEKILWQIRLASFFQADTDNIRQLLGVEERYIVAAFDAIESEWGSFDRYVSEGLGISAEEIARLRSIYLEPNSA